MVALLTGRQLAAMLVATCELDELGFVPFYRREQLLHCYITR